MLSLLSAKQLDIACACLQAHLSSRKHLSPLLPHPHIPLPLSLSHTHAHRWAVSVLLLLVGGGRQWGRQWGVGGNCMVIGEKFSSLPCFFCSFCNLGVSHACMAMAVRKGAGSPRLHACHHRHHLLSLFFLHSLPPSISLSRTMACIIAHCVATLHALPEAHLFWHFPSMSLCIMPCLTNLQPVASGSSITCFLPSLCVLEERWREGECGTWIPPEKERWVGWEDGV